MPAPIVEADSWRMLPALDAANRAFWTGGKDGALLIEHCDACDRWLHPPTGQCPECGGEAHPEPVSGRGTVFAFTVNRHQFHPNVPPPNMIAIVELVEQSDLRIVTNIVGCEPGDLRTGLPVQVRFERHGEVFYPLFEPAASPT